MFRTFILHHTTKNSIPNGHPVTKIKPYENTANHISKVCIKKFV